MLGNTGSGFHSAARMPLAFFSWSAMSLHFWDRRVKLSFKASAMRYFSITATKHVKWCVPSEVKIVRGGRIIRLRRPRGIRYINNNHVCFY